MWDGRDREGFPNLQKCNRYSPNAFENEGRANYLYEGPVDNDTTELIDPRMYEVNIMAIHDMHKHAFLGTDFVEHLFCNCS